MSAGSKRRLAKGAGAETCVQGRHEKLHAAVGTFSSKNEKTDGLGALLEVQMSKNCTPLWREAHLQNTPGSEHFLKLGCGKIARRCSAKNICKSKR